MTVPVRSAAEHADTNPAGERQYELWQRVEGDGEYRWMVWLYGPMTGGETWFETESEAREFMSRPAASVLCDHQDTA